MLKKSLAISLIQFFFFTGNATALINSETMSIANSMGSHAVSEVKFSVGSTSLDQSQKNEIAETVTKARQQGQIDHVRVLAWADQEYPAPHAKYSNADIDLADHRLSEVKDYLKKDLDISTFNISTFNMAEHPNKLQKLFNTADARVKHKVAAEDGASTNKSSLTNLLGLKGQKSKVLVMVFLK